MTPLLLIAGGLGIAAALVLIQLPQAIFYLAVLLSLLPYGLRPPQLDTLYTVAANGTVALAFASWVLDVGTRRRAALVNGTTVALVLFLVWAVVTATWAADLVEARKKLVAFTIDIVLFLVISNQVRDVRAIDRLMAVLRIIGWLMIGCGLYAFVDSGFQFGDRLKVLQMNENDYGLTLIAMITGVIWPVLRRSGSSRGLGMAVSVVFIVCALVLIALTGSRGSSLSLLLVLLAFSFSKPMRPWGVAGLVMLSGCLLAAPFLLESVVNRFAEQDGGQFGGRDVLWKAGLMLLADVPWSGSGIGNGPFALHDYIASLTSDFNHRSNLPSHNPLLEVGVETGVLGLGLYIGACVSAVRQFFGRASRAAMRRPELTGYFPLMLGVGAGYIGSWFKGGGVEDHPTFFLMLALLLIPSRLARASQPMFAERVRSHRPASDPAVQPGAIRS